MQGLAAEARSKRRCTGPYYTQTVGELGDAQLTGVKPERSALRPRPGQQLLDRSVAYELEDEGHRGGWFPIHALAVRRCRLGRPTTNCGLWAKVPLILVATYGLIQHPFLRTHAAGTARR
jgi:hypothetical protein